MIIDKRGYPVAKSHKYCLWMNIPSHHQLDFVKTLHESGVDLKVRFFGKVDEGRRHMGWDAEPQLAENATYVRRSIDALDDSVPDWRERVHIVPGTVGDRFLMDLVDRLIGERVRWVHWSECVKPGWNRIIRLPFRMFYGRKIMRYALGALAVSKMAEKEFISWGVDSKKIRWLPYTVSPLTGSDHVNESIKRFIENRFAFMFGGALCRRKGTDLLLQAFKCIGHRYPSSVLILVGPDTKDRRYEAQAKRLNIPTDRVLFMGPVKFDQMRDILPLCDIFILPSRYDGWGMVIFEAASMGKAVIGTDRCGAAHHIIVDGLNGFRVKAGDADSLAAAMQRYLESPGLAQIHGAHSKIMADFFHPARNVERFLCAMESFLTMQK